MGDSSFQTLYAPPVLTFIRTNTEPSLTTIRYSQYIIPVGQAKISGRFFLLSALSPYCTDVVAFAHLLSTNERSFSPFLLVISFCSVGIAPFFPSRAPFFTLLLNRYPAGCLSLFIWKCALLFLTWAFFFLAILFLPSSSFFLPRSPDAVLFSLGK